MAEIGGVEGIKKFNSDDPSSPLHFHRAFRATYSGPSRRSVRNPSRKSTSAVRKSGALKIWRKLSASAGLRPSIAWPASWKIQPSDEGCEEDRERLRERQHRRAVRQVQQQQVRRRLQQSDRPVEPKVVEEDDQEEDRRPGDRQVGRSGRTGTSRAPGRARR